MLDGTPAIATRLDAIDELDDVRRSLKGLSQIILALEIASLAERDSLDLVARLLDHCAVSLEAATIHFESKG